MAETNPVLYALNNLRSGRSTGVFKGISAAPQISDVATQRTALAASYLGNVQDYESKNAEKISQYDALTKSLEDSVSGVKTAYEGAKTAWDSKLAPLQSAYDTVSADTSSVFNTAQADYDKATTGLAEKKAELAARSDIKMDSEQYAEIMYHIQRGDYNHRSFDDTARWKAVADEIKASLDKRYEPVTSVYKTAKSAYDTATAEASVRLKTVYDPYAAMAEEANKELNPLLTSYQTAAEQANKKSQEAYDSAYSGLKSITSEYEAQQKALDPLGYLAYQGVEESATPSATQGETLAETDLYSDDLNAAMMNKKQQLQNAATAAPGEDLLTGSVQSSLYSLK